MSDLLWIIWLIPLFPLLGFLVNAFFIRNERTAGLVATGAVLLAFVAGLASIAVLAGLPEGTGHIDYVLWEWMTIGSFRVPFGLLFDQLTAVMVLLVTGVGSLIHIFSIGYMHGDIRPVRYFAYLNLFIVAMLFLVMADNMLLLFLGWEGVGLCSFLLIGHWFDRNSVPPGIVPSDAAVKAFVANRVGDAGMLLAMMAIFASLGSLSFYNTTSNGSQITGFLQQAETVGIGFQQIDLGIFGSMTLATAITLLLLVGVTGKSAQIPLFVWLPDAMAGPTPVSALIHAATMVTSGVYLMARNHQLFEQSGATQGVVIFIGVLTALLAAGAAVSQFDIKRVLAYSTISQLGYMVAAAGMGAYVPALFHLLTHGVFKALLFLGSGSIIHGTHDTQDMRRMGGLKDRMRTTWWTYMIGALSLAGIIPLAGFWSKDEIIAHAFDSGHPIYGIWLILASIMTAFYMGRQIGLTFYGQPRSTEAEHAHESGPVMLWPLIILAVGTVLAGFMNPGLLGLHFLNDYLQPVLNEEAPVVSVGTWVLAIFTTLAALGAFAGGFFLYTRTLSSRIKPGKEDPGYRYLGDIWRGSEMAWGFDWLYNRVFIRGYRRLSAFLDKVFDQQGIDGILVNGLANMFGDLARVFRMGQTGQVRNYALVFLIGVIGVVGYLVFSY